MTYRRLMLLSAAVLMTNLAALSRVTSAAPVQGGPCPFAACDTDNTCPSPETLISFCYYFLGCGLPYWCFESASECDDIRARVICNGAEM